MKMCIVYAVLYLSYKCDIDVTILCYRFIVCCDVFMKVILVT